VRRGRTSGVGSAHNYSNFITTSAAFEKYGLLVSFVPARDVSTKNLSDLAPDCPQTNRRSHAGIMILSGVRTRYLLRARAQSAALAGAWVRPRCWEVSGRNNPHCSELQGRMEFSWQRQPQEASPPDSNSSTSETSSVMDSAELSRWGLFRLPFNDASMTSGCVMPAFSM
jgi:hypothetical protein